MIRIWLGFAVLFAVFYFGLPTLRHMTGKEKWNLTKTILFSILCTALTIITITLFVFLF